MRTRWLTAALMGLALALSGPSFGALAEDSEHWSGDDPDRLSEANRALYTTDHLGSITEPGSLVYEFERTGALNEPFTDEVEEKITDVLESGRKNLSFKFFSGRHRVRFPPQYGFNGNPIFMLFLEHDVRDLQKHTGGNALYFRSRIRNALAGRAEVSPTTFTFDGRTYEGTEIRVQPFLEAELMRRFPKFAKRTYSFVLSPDIPGGFYRLRSVTPALEGDDVLSEDTLTFRELVGTEEHSARKGEEKPAEGPLASKAADEEGSE